MKIYFEDGDTELKKRGNELVFYYVRSINVSGKDITMDEIENRLLLEENKLREKSLVLDKEIEDLKETLSKLKNMYIEKKV